MSRAQRILEVLAEGPTTAEEMAIELQEDATLVSSTLIDLRWRGKITATKFRLPVSRHGGSTVNLYALRSY